MEWPWKVSGFKKSEEKRKKKEKKKVGPSRN
jgi:hypothetical protein